MPPRQVPPVQALAVAPTEAARADRPARFDRGAGESAEPRGGLGWRRPRAAYAKTAAPRRTTTLSFRRRPPTLPVRSPGPRSYRRLDGARAAALRGPWRRARDLRLRAPARALGRRRGLGPRDARPPHSLLSHLRALAIQRIGRSMGRREPAPRIASSRVPSCARALRRSRQRSRPAGAARGGLHAHVLRGPDRGHRFGRAAGVVRGPRGAIGFRASPTGRFDRSRRDRKGLARRPPRGRARPELAGQSLRRSVRTG